MKELIYFIAFHFEKKRKGDSYNYNKHVVKYEVDLFSPHIFFPTFRGACTYESRENKSSPPLPFLSSFCLFYRYHFEHHLTVLFFLIIFPQYYFCTLSFSRFLSLSLSFRSVSLSFYSPFSMYVSLASLLRRNFIARARTFFFWYKT